MPGVDVRRRCGDVGDEREPAHPRPGPNGFEHHGRRGFAADDGGSHGALLPRVEDDGARIDARKRGNAVCAEPFGPLRPARRPHDDGTSMDGRRLGAIRQDPVVTNHGSRERNNLFGVARVGDDLLIPGHGRREDGFPEGKPVGADGLTVEENPVLEYQTPDDCR